MSTIGTFNTCGQCTTVDKLDTCATCDPHWCGTLDMYDVCIYDAHDIHLSVMGLIQSLSWPCKSLQKSESSDVILLFIIFFWISFSFDFAFS